MEDVELVSVSKLFFSIQILKQVRNIN